MNAGVIRRDRLLLEARDLKKQIRRASLAGRDYDSQALRLAEIQRELEQFNTVSPSRNIRFYGLEKLQNNKTTMRG